MATPSPPGRLERMATSGRLRAAAGTAAARRASFGGGSVEGGDVVGGMMGDKSFTEKREGFDATASLGLGRAQPKAAPERRISRKQRNFLLGAAFVLLALDALLAVTFCLLAPADPRLDSVHTSRRQLRTVYLQGFVALLDAVISLALVVHVVQGILGASLDNFLEAAAVKLLQATFFSLLQTGCKPPPHAAAACDHRPRPPPVHAAPPPPSCAPPHSHTLESP